MGHVDTRSTSLAYSTKNNIVHPGTAAQATAAESAAASRAADVTAITQDTVSVTTSAITLTKHITR